MEIKLALKVNDKDNVATIFANGITDGTEVEIRDKKGNAETVTVIGCNLVRRTEKGRLRRRGWGLRWEKAQKGGKGTNLRGFFED